ncbi:MAG TPA: SAM-dependent methyltransferase [Thermoplasmatales archaeon]|nr:SAM-dependent methyltransferase [Thermoplasmatales archaeon]
MDESVEELQREVNRAVSLIRRGHAKEKIMGKIKTKIFPKEKILEMARCRIRAKSKFGKYAELLFFDEEGLRYSTPPEVAEYRAERLKSKSIADLGCGVGIQLLHFAAHAEKCVGVEKDGTRAKMAMFNAMAMGRENVEIIEGDVLDKSIAEKIDAETIFCDPARRPEEEHRRFETLSPNPVHVYSLYDGKIAFELPPLIHREEIKIEGEKEYTSLNFRLNRLALYTGTLAECDTSAISLPSRERIRNDDERKEVTKGKKIMNYIYEVDNTIVKARLMENLWGKLSFNGFLISESKRTLLSSDEIYASSFLKRYEVMKICDFSRSKINRELKKLDARKAIPRFSLSPAEYWKIRNSLEEGLKGERDYYIFRVGDRAIISQSSQRRGSA